MSFLIGIVGFFGMIVFIISLLINAIRKQPRKKALTGFFVCLTLFIVGLLISPSSSDEFINTDSDMPEITLKKTTGNNEFLKEDVALIKENPIEIDTYKLSIVGTKFDISSGDSVKDVTFVGDGLVNETFEDGTERGFQIGFENSKAEVKNKDAYLSLYLKFDLHKEDISQRDSIIPKFKIKVKDNKGDNGVLIYNSQKDKYIDTKSPYSVMLFKVFSDSEQFDIIIDDVVFKLNKSELE